MLGLLIVGMVVFVFDVVVCALLAVVPHLVVASDS